MLIKSDKLKKQTVSLYMAIALLFLLAIPAGVMLAQETSSTGISTVSDNGGQDDGGETGSTVPTRTPTPGEKFISGKVILLKSETDGDHPDDDKDGEDGEDGKDGDRTAVTDGGDDERLPVAGARIVARRIDANGKAETTTDAFGQYRLQLSAGLWAVTVLETDESDPSGWVYTRGAQEVKFRDHDEVQRKEINFKVVPTGSTVKGKIVLPDGSAPDFPVEIGVRNGEGIGRETVTKAGDGSFSLSLPSGRYDILIHPKSDAFVGPNLQPIWVKPGEKLDLGKIKLLDLSSSVSGQVVAVDSPDTREDEPEGSGVADIPVVAWNRGSTAVVRTTTDEDGNYTLNLSEGKWRIQPAPGPDIPYLYLGDGKTVRIEAEQVIEDVDFRLLAADATIVGQLVTADGMPVTDVEGWAVAAQPERPKVKFGAPISDGEFKLLVPSGAYSVTVKFAPGSNYSLISRGTATVAAGETVSVTIPVKLKKEKIVGSLIDPRAEDTVVTGVRGKVGAWMNRRWTSTSVDAETGSYQLDVSDGVWQVDYKVDPERYVKLQGAKNIAVPVDQTVEYNLPVTQRDAGISGTVYDPDGAPLAGAIVIFDGTSADIQSLWMHTRTDENGAYSFALPHGEYRVGAVGGERAWINPVELTVDVAAADRVTGIDLNFTKPDAEVTGRIVIPEAPEGGDVLIFGWTEDGGFAWLAAEVELQESGSAEGTYALPVTGGSTWHVGATFEADDSFWRASGEVEVPENGTAVLNFELEGPMSKPAPIVVTFDSAEAQSIELADGTSIFVPAGAMPVTGDVTLRIDPIAKLPHQRHAKLLSYGYAIHATDADGRPIEENFNTNVLIEFPFDKKVIRGLARDLRPAYFSTTTNRWTAPERFAVDLDAGVVKMDIDHFTDFAIMEGEAQSAIYLPLIVR